MDIHEKEISAATIRACREELGLTIAQFWQTIGYTRSSGHCYETEKVALPEHARRLFFLHYVLGIPTDPSSAEYREFDFTTAVRKGGAVNTRKAKQAIERGIALLKQGVNEL